MDHSQYDLADHGAVEAEPDREADGSRNRDQHQIVADVIESCEFEVSEQFVGLGRIDGVDTPDQLGGVFENEKHRIGHQQQHHLVATIKHLQQAALEQQADRGCDQHDGQQHGNETNRWRQAAGGDHGDSSRCDIGAEGIEAAMGNVEDLQDAEDQRQAQGHDEQPRGLNQAIEHDRQKEIHGDGFTLIIGGQDSGANLKLAPLPNYSGVETSQLHFAPCIPPLIQSSDLTPAGGLTHSAAKYSMSIRSTRFSSGLYLVRLKAIGWIA